MITLARLWVTLRLLIWALPFTLKRAWHLSYEVVAKEYNRALDEEQKVNSRR